MQESQITDSKFIEAGKYPPKMFYLADKAFNKMPFPISERIEFSFFFPAVARRDNNLATTQPDLIDKMIGIISFVGNNSVGIKPVDQRFGFNDIIGLSLG